MRRRSFLVAIAALAGAAIGVLPVIGARARPAVVDSMAGKREPEFVAHIILDHRGREPGAPPMSGDLVIFRDPDRVYRAPGDTTPVTRGGIVYWEWRPGRWYACAVKERERWRGHDILTEIMNVSWW